MNESYFCESEQCMKTENDKNVSDYWNLPNGYYIVKIEKKDSVDDGCGIENVLPAHLCAFILCSSSRSMIILFGKIDGLYTKTIYCSDTDSLYIERKYWDVLDRSELVEVGLCQGQNDCELVGIFHGLFLTPKMKNCLTISEFGIMEEQKTFEGFKDSKRPQDRSQNFYRIDGKKILAQLC